VSQKYCFAKQKTAMPAITTRSARTVTALLLLFISLLPGCGSQATLPSPGASDDNHAASQTVTAKYAGKYPIQVVCTIGMVADQVKNIGGEHVQVVSLMGAGVDPHLYKASPADVAQLNRADIIFYSGLHLEGKLAELLERMGDHKPTVAVAERIDDAKILHDEGNAHDPHVWFDVSLWSEASGAVRDALAEFDPTHADDYRAAAQAYETKLSALHEFAKTELATVPKEQRVLVTAHDAFQYFGRAYGVEVRGIQGISTDSEASVKHVNDLVDFLVERRIKAVFVETSVADQNIRSLIEGCAAQNHKVTIGGELFSDAMGPEGTAEGTYEGMVRHNVETIVKALK
jgi:manganese/zinc/iron transport system substrate-binding protein